jgi:hypothetical protein
MKMALTFTDSEEHRLYWSLITFGFNSWEPQRRSREVLRLESEIVDALAALSDPIAPPPGSREGGEWRQYRPGTTLTLSQPAHKLLLDRLQPDAIAWPPANAAKVERMLQWLDAGEKIEG